MFTPRFYFKTRRLNVFFRTTISLALLVLTYHSYMSWNCAQFSGPVDGLRPRSQPHVHAAHIGAKDGVAILQPELSDYSIPASGGHSNRMSGELGATLRQALLLLPNETQIKSLLAPLDMSGTDRVHEIGVRTRTFRILFEAWESVHLIRTHKNIYTRNVVQALYDDPSLTTHLEMDMAQALRSYEKLRYVLSKMATLLFPWSMPLVGDQMDLHIQTYSGHRGIVITAGNKQAPYLLTSIPSMRWLGCDLPIEVMYLGDDDLSPSLQADLAALPGVTVRDLSLMVNDDGWKLAGWAAKPFSILYSRFREVMLVDADALFFQNPDVLFDDKSYQDTGALFFKDRLFMPGSKREWLKKILPHPPSAKVRESRFWTGESVHMQESGVVLVDKWRHFVSLLLVAKLNGPDRDTRDGKQGIYEMVYGKLF